MKRFILILAIYAALVAGVAFAHTTSTDFSMNESTSAAQWAAGRTWATQFADATADATMFDAVNLTYGTDGATPVVRPTDPDTVATFLTKEPLYNFSVRVRYKPAAADGHTISESIHYAIGRHSHFSNRSMYATDTWASTGTITLMSMIANVSGTATMPSISKATLGIDNEDDEEFRYLELEVTEDLMRVRNWVEGGTIPDWQLRRRSRPASAIGGDQTLNTDDPGPGPAGFGLNVSNAAVQEVVVTELLRATTNLLRNATFNLIDSIDGTTPLYWFRNRTLVSGETLDVTSVADWIGRTRPAARVISLGTGTPGVGWTTALYTRSAGILIARHTPHPQVQLGPEIEISIWSKGTSVTNSSPSSLYNNVGLAACIVIKYYAMDTGEELGATATGANPHYIYLGPTVGGLGTWGWHRTKVRMQLNQWHRVGWVTVYMGHHDSTSAGTILMADPDIKVVG